MTEFPSVYADATALAPLWVWIVALAVGSIFAVIAIRLLARYIRAAREARAERRAGRSTNPELRRHQQQRAVLIAALGFCSVIGAAYIVGTYDGAAAFAQDKFGWTGLLGGIPWAALDAAGIGFGLFVVRAAILGRSGQAAMRIVFLSAGFSALIQLVQGGPKHHFWAGAFLAFLAAMFGALMHVVVDQIRDEDIEVKTRRKRPPFGLRWMTSFVSTLLAWLAWVNFPPIDLAPTVPNGLDHLNAVRAAKRARMTSRPGWWLLQPWLYSSRLASALTETREALETERVESTRLVTEIEEASRVALLASREESTQLATQLAQLADELNAARSRVEAIESSIPAREHSARVEGEKHAREEMEEEIADLREQMRENRRTPSSRPARTRTEAPGTRANSQTVGHLIPDDVLAERLLQSFREYTAENDSHPRAYWVMKNAPCSNRQSGRVHELLVKLCAEKPERVAESNARESSGGDDSADSERELVAEMA